jgi:site-specific recombinase XerD
MEWFERQVSQGVTTESRYSVSLRDVDLQLNTIRGSSEGVRFGLTRETEVVRRYMENGREKGIQHHKETLVQFSLRREDQISERIAWALIHASRLCGAPVRAEY